MDLDSHKLPLQHWAAQRLGALTPEQFEERWQRAIHAIDKLQQSLPGSGPLANNRTLLQRFLLDQISGQGLILQIRPGAGPAGLKARVDLEARTVTIYRQAVLEMAEWLGSEQGQTEELALLMLLSHESWHILCPHCPSDWCELAAHLWCAYLTGHIYLETHTVERS